MRLRSHDGPFPQRAVRRCPSVLRRATATVRHLFAPGAPAGLSAGVSGSDVTFSWSAATDTVTPVLGLTYNLRVGTTPGGEEIMSGHAITSPDVRLIPAMGNVQHNTSWTVKVLASDTYYWSVQAVDTGFEGGPWAAEQQVTVP